jgi:hypothetical protein
MRRISKRVVAALAFVSLVGGVLVSTATVSSANPISGAIFTTVANGSEVNFNIYPSKDAVYLNGGPGAHAKPLAAGLPDDTYVFQVTDPSGHTLLSDDVAACRQVVVVGGVFSNVTPSGACGHALGTSPDGGISVKLMPYDDTPNNGGEYKAWVTPVADFLVNCNALGVASGLAVRDCGSAPGNDHGFVGADSKTDNFKVKSKSTVEIDTQFHNNQGQAIDGLAVTWLDTHGAANVKWSYNDPAIFVTHQAHVEAPEVGTHHIVISDQPGCTIDALNVNGSYHGTQGTQDVAVTIKPGSKNTIITIYCA